MGNGNSDYKRQVDDLVKRCEAVGWQVVKTGKNYWKVDTRRGIFTIPSTPGSAHSVQNTVALALKHGLEELEVTIRERRESERLERIRADRRRNDAQYDRIMNGDGDVSTATPATTVAATPSPAGENLGVFEDGTPIAAIGPAMVTTPVMPRPAPMQYSEELLLTDGRIIYRCTRPVSADAPCHRWFELVTSLRAHQASHSRRTTASNHIETILSESESESEIVSTTDRELVITRLEELAGTMFDLGGKLIDVRNGLIAVADSVKKLPDAVEPDPELVAKAAKFDALRSTLGGLIQ